MLTKWSCVRLGSQIHELARIVLYRISNEGFCNVRRVGKTRMRWGEPSGENLPAHETYALLLVLWDLRLQQSFVVNHYNFRDDVYNHHNMFLTVIEA